jgi:hypothetical protein
MPLIAFPPDMYLLREGEAPMYGEFPDLRKCVQWFIGQLPKGEWHARRDTIAKRFYQSLVGEFTDMTGKGRYFDEKDLFGWYLFLGEAFTDHPWNYEVIFGCRVVPILAAIGRDLDLLCTIKGFVDRAKRIASVERAQPNGGLFEILVAAAYAREGWRVGFKSVQRGVARTYDLDIEKGATRYAVECKRMEAGEYVERERSRMRELWKAPCMLLAKKEERSVYLDVNFKIEMKDVPDAYLLNMVLGFIESKKPSLLWADASASGVVGDLDLSSIRESLKTGYLLHPGPVFNKLLTGSYRRYDSMITALRIKHATCPHFVDELDLAIAARWSCSAEAAIDKKARDIQGRLVEANTQLPTDMPGIIHIGFEALSGDDVEQHRYEKILNRARAFDPQLSRLEFIYCHYFAPETTPEEVWAIDETVQWIGVRQGNRPLKRCAVVLPVDEGSTRKGVHWGSRYRMK